MNQQTVNDSEYQTNIKVLKYANTKLCLFTNKTGQLSN